MYITKEATTQKLKCPNTMEFHTKEMACCDDNCDKRGVEQVKGALIVRKRFMSET